MTSANAYPHVTDALLEELSRLGSAIYEEKLKSILEPEYNNKFVAVHVDTGDYAVGRSSAVATRELLQRHPLDGRLFVRKIGLEPEYGLAARLLASEMRAQRPK